MCWRVGASHRIRPPDFLEDGRDCVWPSSEHHADNWDSPIFVGSTFPLCLSHLGRDGLHVQLADVLAAADVVDQLAAQVDVRPPLQTEVIRAI